MHALTKSNIETVKAALSYCEHECGCNPLRAPDFRPTRLLDLGAWEMSNSIRLVDTSSLDSGSAIYYAALSYCWGPTNEAASQLRTTAATLRAYIKLIQADLLTLVIRDAVEATRAFSLRYLWIDALCIIQENHQGWTRESERMDLVYINAYCTICILASSTCLRGFLERKAPVVIGFNSMIRPDVVGRINLRHLPLPEYHNNYDPFSLELGAGAWTLRGWTFQEYCLSARKVFFGHSRMFYSCPKREWTEPSFWQNSGSCSTLADMLQRYERDKDLANLYEYWMEMLAMYSDRHLTVPEDVLPAISGLAKKVAIYTEDTYVAGLWSSDLTRQLLWECTRPDSASFIDFSDVHNYIAPSWSCVQSAGVEFAQLSTGFTPYRARSRSEEAFRPEADIVDFCSLPEDPNLNPWGRISSAHLRVSARYIPVNDRSWVHVHPGFDKYGVDLNASHGFHAVVCILDYNLSSMQKLHPERWLLVLLASSIGRTRWLTWHREEDSVKEMEGDESSSQSAAHENTSSLASSSSCENSVSESNTDHHDEHSGMTYEEDCEVMSEVHCGTETLEGETTDGEDIATGSDWSSEARSHDDIDEDDSENGSDDTSDRNARGLLLYRLNDGRYMRIGCFWSAANQGGLDIFENCPSQIFTIV